ncbi:AAA family ATPase [Micromonospora sp. PSH03]|uniref:AAA family ATPase n=1 Tax=Micromonospora salmantinae TaxID=2911211 RepID=UPI001EE9376A|nr:AAA family ATPase [Micromonospora salmantinae]MCG5458217.1 AAA family ATPase [Micromonospora salmantinae]
MTVVQLDRDIRIKAATYATRLAEVKTQFVDRDDVIDIVAMATLCREHALLIGPPGTAKSSVIDRLRKLLDVRYFAYLLTRFTEPAELFGPLDLVAFQRGSYRVNTDGMLPTAHIAFLDEVFQGSSAILNSLLTIVNERRFYNGSEVVELDLISLFASSNEIPDDPLLAAFSDRFLLRCNLDYVPDDLIEDVLDIGWRGERDRIRTEVAEGERATARTEVTFPLAELIQLQNAVADVDVSGVRDTFAEILRTFRSEGVVFSDRRAVKAMKTFAASALLSGRPRAELSDLGQLVHLWTLPQDEVSIRRILADHQVSVLERGRQVRDITEISLDVRHIMRLRESAQTAEEWREVIRRLHRLTTEVQRDHPGGQEVLGQLQQSQRETVAAYRERFEPNG